MELEQHLAEVGMGLKMLMKLQRMMEMLLLFL